MTRYFTAVFERGVLRPKTPVSLDEGTEVEVIVVPKRAAAGRSPADILAEIAALPTSAGDPFTSRDHDKVLYGEQEPR